MCGESRRTSRCAELIPLALSKTTKGQTTWSGPCTFAQFYCLDFSGGGFWRCCSWNVCTGRINVNANAETPFLPPFPSLPYLVFAGSRDRGSGSPCGMFYTRGLEPRVFRNGVLEGWGFPFDSLHPVGCTFAFWGNGNHKRIYVCCLPTPALCQHHVFDVGPSFRVTSVQQTGTLGSGGGRVVVAPLFWPSAWDFPSLFSRPTFGPKLR